MTRVIGACGYAQNGKDTIANYLVQRYGYTRLAFADTLKSLAVTLNPNVSELPGQPHVIRLAKLVQDVGWEAAKTWPEVRRFLQVLGTEGVRDHLGKDAWVKALYSRWDALGQPNLVVSDVRFENEAEDLDILIRVTRYNEDGSPFDSGVSRNHLSERNVPLLKAHFDIRNDARESDLLVKVDAVMKDLSEGFVPVPKSFDLTAA